MEEVVVVVLMELIHLSLSVELLIVLQLVEQEEDILDLLLLLDNREDLVEEWETFHLELKVAVMQEVLIRQKEMMEELDLILVLHMVEAAVVDMGQSVVTDQVQVVVMVGQEQM